MLHAKQILKNWDGPGDKATHKTHPERDSKNQMEVHLTKTICQYPLLQGEYLLQSHSLFAMTKEGTWHIPCVYLLMKFLHFTN